MNARLLVTTAVLSALCVLNGCRPPKPPMDASEACTAFCTGLVDLGCTGATGSPEGADCITVCADMLVPPYRAQAECFPDADTCEALEACAFDGVTQ